VRILRFDRSKSTACGYLGSIDRKVKHANTYNQYIERYGTGVLRLDRSNSRAYEFFERDRSKNMLHKWGKVNICKKY
jgi:hypothetical protein